MNIAATTIDPKQLRCDCLVLAVYEDAKLTEMGKLLDKATEGALQRWLKRGDFSARLGQKQFLYELPGIAASRVLLVGAGKSQALSVSQYRSLITATAQAVNEAKLRQVASFLTEVEVQQFDDAWKLRYATETMLHAQYRYSATKSEQNGNSPSLQKIVWHLSPRTPSKTANKAIRIGQAIAEGTALARELGNLPPNICTPTYLANTAKKLARQYTLKVSVLDQKRLQALGMGAFLSVAKGSRQPPKLIVLEYRGGRKSQAPVTLVGKGITFDSGGISIKPAAAMDEMKFDMCGAASVLGTFKAAAQLKLPLNLIGVIPACENLPDGNANKPGDIVTSLSGQTIEVLNTDAEGRLILCDALSYVQRFKPKAVIDIATLTGACVIALGNQASGLLGNDQALIDKLLDASQTSADRTWQLPMWEEYQEQLKSNFADVANVGGREAGTITGACFLSRFAKKYAWAHLDIAGVAWQGGAGKGATGRPVPLLTQYLIDQSGY